MGLLTLQGTLTSAPPTSSDNVFPSESVNLVLAFVNNNPRSFNQCVAKVMQFNSPTAFQTVTGVGPTENITKGQVLYMRAQSQIQYRITSDDGSGNPVVELGNLGGLYLKEFQDSKFLRLVELFGVSVVEFFVAGL